MSNKALQEMIYDGSNKAMAVDWEANVGMSEGLCIPISYYLSNYLVAKGIRDARVIEAGAIFRDPASPRFGFLGGDYEDRPAQIEDVLKAEDAKGLEFFGHTCVWLPTHRLVIDASLPSQPMKILSGLGVKDVLVVSRLDHTKGEIGFTTQLGRGTATYRIYPKRDGWRHRSWPWENIKALAEHGARFETVYYTEVAH